MFEKLIAEQIRNNWHANKRLAPPKTTAPEVDDILAVVESAFLGSLKKEEGEPVTFSLAFISRKQVSEEHIMISFDKRYSLNVETISKLAPAFDKAISALVVEPETKDVWGAIHWHLGKRPECLAVTTASAGSLLIGRGDHLLGYFDPDSEGVFVPSVPSPFVSQAMGNYIKPPSFEPLVSVERFSPEYGRYLGAIQELLTEAEKRGHGGSIIMIPRQKETEAKSLYEQKYPFSNEFGADSAFAAICEPVNDQKTQVRFNQAKRELSERLEQIAQLACTDGALIITAELRVLAFGATLTAKNERPQVLIGPTGLEVPPAFAHERFDPSKLGTRHNSAIKFVSAIPGAIGFVISADGPIRGLARAADGELAGFIKNEPIETVLLWRDCRPSMYVPKVPYFV